MENKFFRKYTLYRELREFPRVVCSATRTYEWIFMAVCLMFCLLTMFYADMTVTGPFSVLLWDSLFDGRLLSFYSNCLESGIAPEGAVYDIGIYVIFAIWNLPVWILNKLTGISLTSVFALLWYKILPVLYTLASVVTVRDIAFQLGVSEKSADAAGVLYLVSVTVVLPVFVTAQYDTITVWFILKGLQCWIKEPESESCPTSSGRGTAASVSPSHEESSSVSAMSAGSAGREKNAAEEVDGEKAGEGPAGRKAGKSRGKKLYYSMRSLTHNYLYWFAISLITKPMGILILFLLVILREKRTLYIILDLARGCSLLILCKAVYSLSDAYQASAMNFQGGQMESLLGITIEGSYGGISLFILGLMVVYVAAYLYDGKLRNSQLESGRTAVIFGFAIWALFCLFGNMTCYWTIYLTPFLILTIFLAGKDRDRLLLLDWIGEMCLTILLILQNSWVYGGEKTYTYLILKPLCSKILSGVRQVTVAGFLRQLGLEDLSPALMAVVAGWLLMTGISALRNPVGSEDPLYDKEEEFILPGHRCTVLRCHIVLRILTIGVWIVMTLGALYYMVV